MACIRILNVYVSLLSTLQVIFSLSVPSFSPLLIITSVLLQFIKLNKNKKEC